MIDHVLIHAWYLHLPSGRVGMATTYSPPTEACRDRRQWTTLSPGGRQFGPGSESNFTAFFDDLVLADIPDLQDPGAVRAWLEVL